MNFFFVIIANICNTEKTKTVLTSSQSSRMLCKLDELVKVVMSGGVMTILMNMATQNLDPTVQLQPNPNSTWKNLHQLLQPSSSANTHKTMPKGTE